MNFQGARILPGHLPPELQSDIVEDLRTIARAAPFRQFMTPMGRPMSVKMTSAGRVGWVADRQGYRYSATQPDGLPWPPIPQRILSIWHGVTALQNAPDCCLVNYYNGAARMGLHQDRDEGNFDWPVVSVSLGDDALFRVGTTERRGPTKSVWLNSGDVIVLEGPSRLAYHGIDKLRPASSRLLKDGGRLNVTLRVVDDP